MLTFQGTVTEVFTDCQSHLGLDDQGKVVDLGPASCDGGSWIEIDGTRIRTSSGFVSSDQAYDRHPAGLRPGQQATVVAYKTASGLTLECVLCKVSIRN
jgi:hypothetical protein